MPVVVHGLDDAANDELVAFATAGREQHLEVVLAVPSPLKLVEHIVRESSETLRANKALRVPQLSVRVDYLLLRFKPFTAPRAHHRLQRHL